MSIIDSKYAFRNKFDKISCENKVVLVAKKYSQQEGIDYIGTYVHIVILKGNSHFSSIYCLP